MPNLSEIDSNLLGRVYVLAFDSGEFKVGQSINFRSRLGQLATGFRRRAYHPTELVDGWYSIEHASYQLSETRLLAFCLERFGMPSFGAETFQGDFKVAAAYAEQITEAASRTACTCSLRSDIERQLPIASEGASA